MILIVAGLCVLVAALVGALIYVLNLISHMFDGFGW